MKNKRFYIRKLAEVVRSHFKEQYAVKHYKDLRRDYRATRHFLPEFNTFCIHRNLHSVVRSLTDYQLARFLMSRYVSKEPVWQGRHNFTRWQFEHRDALVLWYFKLPILKGPLPHIAEEFIDFDDLYPGFEITDLVIHKGKIPPASNIRRQRKREAEKFAAWHRKQNKLVG